MNSINEKLRKQLSYQIEKDFFYSIYGKFGNNTNITNTAYTSSLNFRNLDKLVQISKKMNKPSTKYSFFIPLDLEDTKTLILDSLVWSYLFGKNYRKLYFESERDMMLFKLKYGL